MVKVAKEKEPPYGDSKELKFLNSIKVHHMKVNYSNIALYVNESEEILSCYYAINPTFNNIET